MHSVPAVVVKELEAKHSTLYGAYLSARRLGHAGRLLDSQVEEIRIDCEKAYNSLVTLNDPASEQTYVSIAQIRADLRTSLLNALTTVVEASGAGNEGGALRYVWEDEVKPEIDRVLRTIRDKMKQDRKDGSFVSEPPEYIWIRYADANGAAIASYLRRDKSSHGLEVVPRTTSHTRGFLFRAFALRRIANFCHASVCGQPSLHYPHRED